MAQAYFTYHRTVQPGRRALCAIVVGGYVVFARVELLNLLPVDLRLQGRVRLGLFVRSFLGTKHSQS